MRTQEQNRDRVLTAARRQFFQVGYEKTTMRGIASAAGVSIAMPNYYFASKVALGVEIYTEVRSQVGEMAQRWFPEEYNLLPRIFTAVTMNTLLTITSSQYRELYLTISSSQQFYSLMTRAATNVFTELSARGYEEQLHAVAAVGVHSALLHYLESSPEFPVKELVFYYVRQYLRPMNLSPQLVASTFETIYQMLIDRTPRLEEDFSLRCSV